MSMIESHINIPNLAILESSCTMPQPDSSRVTKWVKLLVVYSNSQYTLHTSQFAHADIKRGLLTNRVQTKSAVRDLLYFLN